jgi:hypothetical protein
MRKDYRILRGFLCTSRRGERFFGLPKFRVGKCYDVVIPSDAARGLDRFALTSR